MTVIAVRGTAQLHDLGEGLGRVEDPATGYVGPIMHTFAILAKGYWEDATPTLAEGSDKSGHYGHLGRPGKRGGSLPKGGSQTLKKAVSSPPVDVKDINRGANVSVRVFFADGTSALVKTADAYNDIEPEVAAYIVDRELGLNRVPETIFIDYDIDGNGTDERCSAQLWLDNSCQGDEIEATHIPEYWKYSYDELEAKRAALINDEDIQRLVLLDYVVYNSDRHGGNWLLADGRIRAIDNGLAQFALRRVTLRDFIEHGTRLKREVPFLASNIRDWHPRIHALVGKWRGISEQDVASWFSHDPEFAKSGVDVHAVYLNIRSVIDQFDLKGLLP